MADYITKQQLQTATPGDDASSTDDQWTLIAGAVSRLFDRECEVEDGFFAVEPAIATKTYRADGTRYLKLDPYVADSIDSISIAGTEFYQADQIDRKYVEKGGYIVFGFDVAAGTLIDVHANFGFGSTVPSDIQQACIEMGLAMWRRKDMSFADLSGVSGSVAAAEFTPTFVAVTKRYREIYSNRSYFA